MMSDDGDRQGSARNSGLKWHDFSEDIDLDIPFWRFPLLAAVIAGSFLGLLALTRGGLDEVPASGWLTGVLIAAVFLVPPLVWRWCRRTLPTSLSFIVLVALLIVSLFILV